MATDFDRFLAGLVSDTMGGPAPMPGIMAPQPAPQPIMPQRPNPFDQAAQGIPPQIAQMVAQAAIQAGTQQAAPPAPAPVMPQQAGQNLVPPDFMQQFMAMQQQQASTQPMPMQQQPQAQTQGPAPGTANPDEGYVEVVLLEPNGNPTNNIILVPQRYASDLPPNAVLYNPENPRIVPASEAEKAPDLLLQNQSPDVVAAFRPREEVVANRADDPARQREIQRVQDANQWDVIGGNTRPPEKTPEQVPEGVQVLTIEQVGEVNPALAGVLQQAGVTSYRTDQIPVVDPTTGQITLMTETDAVNADMYMPVELFTSPDDPEANTFVSNLKASGIDSIRQSDVPWLYNPDPADTTKWALIPENQRQNINNPAVPVEPLTSQKIRETGGEQGPAIANEMERQNINEIPDGQMLVRDDATGALKVVEASETAPAGTTYLYWGGDRPQLSQDFEGSGSLGEALWFFTGKPLFAAMNQLDRPRQGMVSNMGEAVYSEVTGNDTNQIGPDALWQLDATFADLGINGVGSSFVEWGRANPDAVKDVYEKGYDSDGDGKANFTGGRAVWEKYASTLSRTERVVGDIFLDPLNATGGIGLGLRGGARRFLPEVAGVGTVSLQNRLLGEALDLTGRVLQAPDQIPGAIGRLINGGPTSISRGLGRLDDIIPDGLDLNGELSNVQPGAVSDLFKSIPGVGKIFEPTANVVRNRMVEPVAETMQNLLKQVNLGPGSVPPGVAGPPAPNAPRGPQGPTGPMQGPPPPGGTGPQLPGLPTQGSATGPNAAPSVANAAPTGPAPVPGRFGLVPGAPIEGGVLAPLDVATLGRPQQLSRLEQSIYQNVSAGNMDIEDVLDARWLQNTDNAGVLLDLTPQQRASLNPMEQAVYDGRRSAQLDTARANVQADRPSSQENVRRGYERATGTQPNRDTLSRLDAIMGQPQPTIGASPSGNVANVNPIDPGNVLTGTPLERADDIPLPMNAAPAIPYDPLRGTAIGRNVNPQLSPAIQGPPIPRERPIEGQAARGIFANDLTGTELANNVNPNLAPATQGPGLPREQPVTGPTAPEPRGLGVPDEDGQRYQAQVQTALEQGDLASAQAAFDTWVRLVPRSNEVSDLARSIHSGDLARARQSWADFGATAQQAPLGAAPEAAAIPNAPEPAAAASPPQRPQWSFATPDDATPGASGNRIIERAWIDGQANPQEWDAFVRQHDPKAQAFVASQRDRTTASIAEREGGNRTGFDYATEAQKQIDEAEYVLQLVGDFNTTIGRTAGPINPSEYHFRQPQSGRDVYFIEQAIFGEGGQRARGMGTLRSRAKRDPNLASMLPKIENLASRWDRYRAHMAGQVDLPTSAAPTTEAAPVTPTPPVATTAAPAPDSTGNALRMTIRGQQYEIRSVPVGRIRTARELTPERRAELGISDFQMRDADFAESTARNVQDNFDVNLLDPLKAVLGDDGNYYVTSGHSRLRGFQRAGDTEVPVQIMVGSSEDIRRAGRLSNTSGTDLVPTEQGNVIRALMDEDGLTKAEAQQAQNIESSTLVDHFINVSYIDPQSPLGQAINNKGMPLNKGGRIGKAIADGKINQTEADAIFRSLFDGTGKTGSGKVMTLDGLDDEIDKLYRWKIESADGGNPLGLENIESDRFKAATEYAAHLKKTRAQLENRRREITGTERQGLALTPEQAERVSQYNDQIDAIRREEMGNQADQREAFFAGNTAAQPAAPEPFALRPMTEADSAARAASLQQNDMGLGIRPEMQGGRQGVPGEALDANDLLQQPERSAADAMRENGAKPLFLTRQAESEYTARQWYNRTLGRQVRNPNAKVRSPFLSTESRPIDRRLQVWGENLDDTEWKVLNQRFSDSQDTIFDRLRRYTDEVKREQPDLSAAAQRTQAANRAFFDWNVDALRRSDPKAAARFDAEYARLMDKKDADAFKAQLEAMDFAMGRDRHANFYDTYLGIQRELKLYNPITGGRYIATQAVGNTITALLVLGLRKGGEVARLAFSGEQVRGSLDEVRGLKQVPDFLHPIDLNDVGKAFNAEEVATPNITMDHTDWQMSEFDYVSHADISRHVREDTLGLSQAGNGPTRVASTTGRLADQANRLRLGRTHIPKLPAAERRAARLARDEKIGRFTGWASSEWVRDLANTMDLTYRRSLWSHTMSANIATVREDFFQQLRDNLPDGADVGRLDEILDTLPADFGSRRLRGVLDEFGGNYAERMARDWKSALSKMDRSARDEVNRVFFSGQETKFDAAVRRVFMFHYWMSRATPLYTAALMKNPGVANAYFKMMQEAKDQAASGEYGGAVSGMLKVMDSWFGYNLFIRPDAFLQTIFAVGNDQKFSNEDASGIWRLMDSVGLMPSPMIDAFMNLTGYQGQNTFTPDLLGLSTHFNFGSSMIDLFKSRMGLDVSEPTMLGPETLLANVRTVTSGVLPGSVNVPFSPPDSYATVEINQNILDIAEEEGLDWTDPQDKAVIVGAMGDPDSTLYREAFGRYANSNAAEWGLRFVPLTSILYPKLRQAGADRRRSQLNNAVPGSDEQQALRDQREAAITDDPNTRTLRMQSDEYQRLGDRRDQDAYRQYNAIRFGEVGGTIRAGGTQYSEHQLRAMSEDDRALVADQWATDNGYTDGVERQRQLREDYRASHPEYAEYYEWAKRVREYEGGPMAYWKDILSGGNGQPTNPNAARWYRENVTDDMPLSALQRDLTGMNAFIAQRGMRPSAYDPSPISVNNAAAQPYDPSAVSGTGDGSGEKTTSDPAQGIAQDIADYRQEAADIDAQLAARFGEGVTWATIENANPMLQSALLQHMDTAGIPRPSLSGRAQEYLTWAESQPAGSDTSINAYLKWQEQFSTQTSVPANAGSLPVGAWTGTTPP